MSVSGCLTSHATIFQLCMWRHTHVQADWRSSWTYGRAPNAEYISKGSRARPSTDTGPPFLQLPHFSSLIRRAWGLYGWPILVLTLPGYPRGTSYLRMIYLGKLGSSAICNSPGKCIIWYHRELQSMALGDRRTGISHHFPLPPLCTVHISCLFSKMSNKVQ